MIVRPRPHWLHLLFVRHGSVLGRILPQLLFTTALACAVVLAHGTLFAWKVTLNTSPFSLMGVALAIFLGFRVNTSYDRYWEARKLWGATLIESRNLARQALTQPNSGTDARPFVLAIVGFAASMRNQLRGQDATTSLAGLLPEALIARLAEARTGPSLVLLWLGQWIGEQRGQGRLDPMLAQRMEATLDRLGATLGGCERIANTPLPFTYSVILHRSVYLFCMLLPFGLVDAIGAVTPVVVAFVAYTFFAMEALSDEIEEPFGEMPNDLALDAMVTSIETSLREMLGEAPPPMPVPGEDFVLR